MDRLTASPPSFSARPHPALLPYVRLYAGASIPVAPGETFRMPVSALHACVAMVRWGGEATTTGTAGRHVVFPFLALAGPLTQAFENVLRGNIQGFFVRFTPLGARTLFGVPSGGLADALVEFDAIGDARSRAQSRAWAEQVAGAPSWEARAALTDAFLLHRLACAKAPDPRVAAAVGLVERSSGTLRIAALSHQLGLSPRALRRCVFEETGMTPKLLARLVRFRRALALLHGPAQADWADVVVSLGYVDQAHLVNEFRTFSGAPPTRWLGGGRAVDQAMLKGEDEPA